MNKKIFQLFVVLLGFLFPNFVFAAEDSSAFLQIYYDEGMSSGVYKSESDVPEGLHPCIENYKGFSYDGDKTVTFNNVKNPYVVALKSVNIKIAGNNNISMFGNRASNEEVAKISVTGDGVLTIKKAVALGESTKEYTNNDLLEYAKQFVSTDLPTYINCEGDLVIGGKKPICEINKDFVGISSDKDLTDYSLEVIDNKDKISNEKMDLINTNIGGKLLYSYDVNLLNGDNTKVTNGNFKIKFPINDELKKYSEFKAVYLDSNYDVKETFEVEKVNDYLVFSTNHLSNYALVGLQTMGDINNDGKIDLKDVIKLLKVYLKVEEAPSNIIEVGDMNNNGKIDMNDIIKLLKTYLNS